MSLRDVQLVLERTLSDVAMPAQLRALLERALRQPGKTLSGAESPLWPAVVLAACRSAGGDESNAPIAAAAVELFAAALDILDDVEDGDASEVVLQGGMAQATNASTTLLFLSQTVLGQLAAQALPLAAVADLQNGLARFGLAATYGQHLDLSSATDIDATTEQAVEIARRKAGSLVAGAAWIGARLGTTSPDLLALYEEWGREYGTAAQLANDLHDALRPDEKSDVDRGTATLPIIYQRRSAPRGMNSPQASATGPSDFGSSGALHFTWTICELHRRRAAGILDQLAARGQNVSALRAIAE